MTLIDLIVLSDVALACLWFLVAFGIFLLAQFLGGVWQYGRKARQRREELTDWQREGNVRRW